MGYIEKNLVPGEKVLYKTGLHWIVLIWPLIGGVVLGGIGLVFVVGGYEASGKGSSWGFRTMPISVPGDVHTLG
jgi:hypothetical protein